MTATTTIQRGDTVRVVRSVYSHPDRGPGAVGTVIAVEDPLPGSHYDEPIIYVRFTHGNDFNRDPAGWVYPASFLVEEVTPT